MALKTLMLRRQIDLKKKALGELNDKLAGFATREAELEQAISEVETDEQRNAVEEEIAAFETERSDTADAVVQLTDQIRNLEEQLDAEEAQRTAMEADERQGMVEQYLETLLPASWPEMDLYERRNYLSDRKDPTLPKGTVRREKVYRKL